MEAEPVACLLIRHPIHDDDAVMNGVEHCSGYVWATRLLEASMMHIDTSTLWLCLNLEVPGLDDCASCENQHQGE